MISKLLSLFCTPAKKSNARLLVKNTFGLLLFLLAVNVQGQVSSYTIANASGTAYADLVSPVNLFGTSWTNSVAPNIPLGFNFNFNGQDYNQCNISTNGFITFGAAPAINETAPISSTVAYDGVIAAYGRQNYNSNLPVSYKTEGLAPNRTFTVQFIFKRGTVGTNGGTYNAQIVLNETTGVINLKYKTVALESAAVLSLNGQVGLRGISNADFNNKNYTGTTGNWPAGGLSRGTLNTHAVNTRSGSTAANLTNNVNHMITYTPPTCFAPKNPFAQPMSISQDAATIQWTAATPPPANGYDYLVSTTAPNNLNVTYPVAGTVATGTVAAGVTTVAIPSGLTVDATYYIYVRSKCAGNSGWSAPGIFKTLCNPHPDPAITPYTQNFTSATVGVVPPSCNYINTTGGTNTGSGFWNIANASAPDWGFTSTHARINSNPTGDPANNSAYIPEGFYLDQNKSYRVSYRYGAASARTFTSQNLRLAYGTKPLITALTNPLATHTSFRGGPYTNVVNFSVPVSGVYYLGFIDSTLANNETTLLDDITVTESTCLVPVNPLAGGVTAYTAIISWTPPATAPSNGYQYYLSTSNTIPSSPAVVNLGAGVTSASLSGLLANTDYYWWVRSNCGNGDVSAWTLISTFHTLTAPVLLTYCTPNFSAGAEPICRVIFNAIDNASSCTTGGAQYSDYRTISTTVNRGSTYPITVFGNTDGNFSTYINVFIDFNQNGTFESSEEFQLGFIRNCSNCAVTGNITIPAGATLGYTTMRVLKRFSTYATACNTGGYGEAEDYSINIKTAAPPLALTSNLETICAGQPVSVSITGATVGNYNSYTWSPSGLASGTAPTYTFTPTTSGIYTLTGLNTTTFETNSVKFEIRVNEAPTAVVVTPATSTYCQAQPPQMLTSSGGISNGMLILREDFETGAGGWTAGTAGSGGNVADGNWFLYEDGDYVFDDPVHSNDNSGFAAVNSDLQGPLTLTNSSLYSPVLDLTAYTTASLSFWHYYYRYNGPESANVEVSRDGGVTFAAPDRVYFHNGSTNIGTRSNFVNTTIDLTAYAGLNNIVIRFRYTGAYDYGWAIDNVLITGSAASAVVWTPAAGLFTDAAGTVPYVGGTGSAVVYAAPANTETYTATVTAPGGTGCTTSTTATVNVTRVILAEPTPVDQSTCTGIPTQNIVMTIPVGASVTKWQYATTAAFTTPSDIAVTTATLTPTQLRTAIGVLTGDIWLRAVVSGCGVKNSDIVKITVPSTTWNGTAWSNLAPDGTKMVVYRGNATIASNMNACALVVKSGTVTVNSGITVDLAHAVTVDGGSLTFLDDASLLQTATGNDINTGNIVYIRNSQTMIPYDYTYWSSPVQFQTLFDFSPETRFDKYFEWNPVLYEWAQIALPGSTAMTPGKGYIIRAGANTPVGGAFHPGNFIGIPNNGTITQQVYVDPFDLTKDNNLLGNPYPSAIDAEALMRDPANAVSLGGGTTFYYWTHNHAITNQQYNDSDYASYNYTGGTGTTVVLGAPGPGNTTVPTKYIAAGQGFIAAVKGSGYSTVTFNNAIRVAANNTNFYKTQESVEKHRVWLELKDGNRLYKQILVGYIEGATDAYDNGYDGGVLDGGNGISFYSFIGDEAMNTQGKALPFNDSDQVLLGYKAGTAGMLHIAMPLYDGLFNEQAVYLEDRLLQVVHDLRQGEYSFATEAGTFNGRFVLRYTDTTLGNQQVLENENAVVVYKNNNIIHFRSTGFDMENIKIYDINGRVLTEKIGIGSTSTEISNLQVAQQVLLVTITTKSGAVIHKKIIF